MSFDLLLDRIWGYDCETFAHDTLFVFINYRTKQKVVFHNALPEDYQNFIDEYNPILMGYNNNGFDKWILKCCLNNYTPEEIKEVADYIVNGGNAWDIDTGYAKLPTQIDLINCIIPRKSLKELEGNLCMNITETTVPFDLPDKWNKKQYEEVLYYCTCDVEALFPIFDMLMTRFKSKYIIARLGNIDEEYALSLTDANLTAVLLGAKRKEHDDNFAYVYPDVIDKTKIPQSVLNYIDDLIEHNDLNYKPDAPSFKIDDCLIQLGTGGLHGAKETTFVYGENEVLYCE